jgi:hypothetical protein
MELMEEQLAKQEQHERELVAQLKARKVQEREKQAQDMQKAAEVARAARSEASRAELAALGNKFELERDAQRKAEEEERERREALLTALEAQLDM